MTVSRRTHSIPASNSSLPDDTTLLQKVKLDLELFMVYDSDNEEIVGQSKVDR